jgi:hypothetical protein
MNSKLRLLFSALVSLVFYFCWSYWANSMATDDQALILRSAIVQGVFSATVTLVFTLVLEISVKRFGGNCLSLIFIVPVLCSVHSKTTQNLAIFRTFNTALNLSAGYLKGAYVPGTLLAPLLPLFMQGSLVITVNVLNHTPNLWLTVAPSIILTALYGYIYTYTLLGDKQKNVKL